MDGKQFHRRVWVLVGVLGLVLLTMGAALYDTQQLNGAYYYKLSQQRVAEVETVEADRGDVLDSYGRLLVSSRTVYQVTLDTTLMGEAAQRNAILLAVIETAREREVSWPDTLPISEQAPFRFTVEEPYYTTSADENGSVSRSLTRLGKLAVNMKWISDPTKKAAVKATAVEEPGFFDKILIAVGLKQAPAPATQTVPQSQGDNLPTAEELLGRICKSFTIQGEGALDPKKLAEGESVPALNIGDMDAADARAVAGVLYELTLRSKGIYWTPYVFAQDVDIDFISRVKELSLSGVVVEPTSMRQYHTQSAPHLLGRVAAMSPTEWEYYQTVDADGDGKADYQMDDTVGKEGTERAFESYLRGTAGTRTVERNAAGKVVASSWTRQPEQGENIVLTLEEPLQTTVERTLAEHLPNLGSKEVEGAACVILDVNSGAVLASASYPTYDLSTYSADIAQNNADPLRPLYNRALQGTYAPGSTFKMVTAIAGLQEGVINTSSRIYDEGRYTFYTENGPMCWIYRQTGATHGWENVSGAITDSCNYFFFDVGRQLGIRTLVDYATRFGLGQSTGIEVGDSAGVMASPEYTQALGGTWYDGNTLSVAIGQESSQFTPIQLASYIATLVNGGTRYETHLLKQIKSGDYSEVLYTYEPKVLSTIDIAPQNLAAVKEGMLKLTTEGSVARYFRNLDFQVGAKTGSAQVSTQTESNAVFVCFAPYDDPQIALSIVVEHGGSGSELGAMAAEILQYYFSARESREVLPRENELIR